MVTGSPRQVASIIQHPATNVLNSTIYHAPTPPLDRATKLTGSVVATFRPTVGEHSVTARFVAEKDSEKESVLDPARSRREAQRRARVQVRRFCKHHKIWRLVTLTLAEETGLEDRERVRRMVVRFLEGLRRDFPRLAYVYTLELHPGGHGYHVHLGFSLFVDQRLIKQRWTHGFIDVRAIIDKKRRSGKHAYEGAARYLAKYAVKAEDEGRLAGKHRYERSQSGPIPEIRIECDSFDEAVKWVRSQLKTQDVWEWRSWIDCDDWCGPKTHIIRE